MAILKIFRIIWKIQSYRQIFKIILKFYKKSKILIILIILINLITHQTANLTKVFLIIIMIFLNKIFKILMMMIIVNGTWYLMHLKRKKKLRTKKIFQIKKMIFKIQI